MTVSVGAGSTVAIATTYGTASNMTALTNATEAVATLAAAHGVVVGDFLEITSGWAKLDKRIVRAKTVSTNDVTLEGINTVSTTDYPAGTGTGSIRRITAWTPLAQVKADSFSVSGGDQQFTDATPLDSLIDIQIPTTRSPYAVSLAVMDSSAGLTAARAAGLSPTAFRLTNSVAVTVGNAYWSVSDVPNVSGKNVTTFKTDLTFVATPKTY